MAVEAWWVVDYTHVSSSERRDALRCRDCQAANRVEHHLLQTSTSASTREGMTR
jgi:hypothetical protein